MKQVAQQEAERARFVVEKVSSTHQSSVRFLLCNMLNT